VYAGLTGPVFAVSELSQSADAAFFTACDLLELGLATRVVAGGVAPRDQIVDRVLGPLHQETNGPRGEGAGFVLVADADALPASAERHAEVLGRFAGAELASLPELGVAQSAIVVLGAADAETRRWLEASSWRAAPRRATFELGTYLGIRRGGRLVAMARPGRSRAGWTEISAVCTDPRYRGRGLAGRLVRAVVHGLRARGDRAFLHATATNTGAIRLYEALGFRLRRTTQVRSFRVPGGSVDAG